VPTHMLSSSTPNLKRDAKECEDRRIQVFRATGPKRELIQAGKAWRNF
jgi:hypothetical protein